MAGRYNAWKRAAAAASLAVFVIGCASEQTQREPAKPAGLREDNRVQREPSMAIGGQEASDLAGRIIVGMLTAIGEPARDAQGRTTIIMPDLVNRSSAPNEGVIALGDELRADLAAAGEASGLLFVDDGAVEPARAQYVIAGEAYTVQRSGRRYWEVFFILYDVDAATGARHDRRWENARGYLVPR